MEDYPSEESWKIEEYSKSNEKNEDVRWIWKMGICLGKNIVLTSVVISCAPITIPPLVAISSFGFICSLPVGFAIVTYACTEKLINTLLPMPSPPLLPNDRTKSFDNKEEHRVDNEEGGHEENVDIEAEEEEFKEDTRMGVEMRIELVNEVDNEIPDDTVEGDRSVQVNEIIVEDGCEEDDVECMENEEQYLNTNAIADRLEGIRQGGDENGKTEMFGGINEEEMRSETIGLIEEMGDESIDQHKNQENEVKRDILMKYMAESSGNRGLFVIPEEMKPVENVDGSINAHATNDALNYTSIQKVHERKTEGVESASLNSDAQMVVQVKTLGNHTVTEVLRGRDSDWNKGPLIISNEDVRELADESGFNLFDDDTLGSDQTTITVDQSSEGEPSSDDIIDVNIEYHEVLIASEVSEPKGVATVALKHDIKEGSNKGLVSEEKMREQIQAMRAIIGCNERPHPSFVEELKALYVITGVEPPDSLRDRGDINEKLQVLISIIGVK